MVLAEELDRVDVGRESKYRRHDYGRLFQRDMRRCCGDHVAGVIPYFCIWMGRCVVEKIGDLLHGVFGWFGLSGRDRTKGNKHREIDGDRIVEEYSYYGLDVTDLGFREVGRHVVVRNELGGGTVGGFIPGVGGNERDEKGIRAETCGGRRRRSPASKCQRACEGRYSSSRL